MVKRSGILSQTIFILVITINFGLSSANTLNYTLEWRVSKWDTMTYTFTKYSRDVDGDGDKTSDTFLLQVGSRYKLPQYSNITLTNGTRMKIEILAFYYDSVWVNTTINGEYLVFDFDKTPPERIEWWRQIFPWVFFEFFVQPTVNNRTFWEEYSQGDEMVDLQDDLIVFSDSSYPHNFLMKMDWRTGWIKYLQVTELNSADPFTEMELTADTPKKQNGSVIPGFEFFSLFLGLTTVTIITIEKRKVKSLHRRSILDPKISK